MFEFNKEGCPVRIKIIGVGDFGAKIVNYSIEKILLNVKFAVIATKDETLLNSSAPQRVKVEDNVSEKSKRIFSELMTNVDLLFIFTDLTDENISNQIAELSKDILTVAIVPESAPNKEKFQKSVDTLISVEDENIFMMYSVVRCINSIVNEPQLVGVDFADVRSVLLNSGRCYVAYGKIGGKTPVVDTMKLAINSIQDILRKSKRILFCIVRGNKTIIELNEAVNMIQEAAHQDAEIIFGATHNVTNTDFVEVIIILADMEK